MKKFVNCIYNIYIDILTMIRKLSRNHDYSKLDAHDDLELDSLLDNIDHPFDEDDKVILY